MWNKNKNNNKKRKNIIYAIIIVIVTIGFFVGENYVEKIFVKEISYNEFMTNVQSENITKVTINKNTGKMYYQDNEFCSYYSTYPGTEDFIENLLKEDISVKIVNSSKTTDIISLMITPVMLIFFLIAFEQIGSSDLNISAVTDSKTTFNDVAGMDELKGELSFIAEMMKNPEYRNKGAKIPRGILLEGPPGNGKTLIAKAFAGEAGVNFIPVNACDFGSKYMGVGSSKINKVFKKAREMAPCVIFIDEIDSVGAKRSDGGGSAADKEANTIVTSLLNNMDGFNEADNILVLAATNRADALDKALLRPGRFDRKFIVNLPDKITRTELLEFYTKDKELSDDADIEKLAGRMFGYSCSEIAAIVNQAVINSVRNNHDVVCYDDFDKAILETQLKGHMKERYDQSNRVRKITAYHEAGHAIISHFYCDKKVQSVTIRPTTSGAGGFTISESSNEELSPISEIKKQIVMCYGGRASEISLLGGVENATSGAVQDIQTATHLAKNYVLIHDGIDYSQLGDTGSNDISVKTKALLQQCSREAVNTININWHYVEVVAEKLLEVETLSYEDFISCLNSLAPTEISTPELENCVA